MRKFDSGLALTQDEGIGDPHTFLRHVPFLRRLSDHDVRVLADTAEVLQIAQDRPILQEGDDSDALYFVFAGRVQVEKSRSGPPQEGDQRQMAIHTIERGSVFGEMSFLDGEPASATVRASEPSVVLRIAGSALDAHVAGAGRAVRDHLNGAVAGAVIARLRLTSQSHAEALQREIGEVRLRSHFERFFMATMGLFGIASLVQKTIQADTSPLAHMGLSWGFLLLSVAPMAWFAWQQQRPLADFGLTLEGWRQALLEGVSSALVAVLLVITVTLALRPGEPVWTWGSVRDYNHLEFAFFVAGYPVHSALQEFIGRGVIQSSLARFMTGAPAYAPVLLTSILFGVYHLYVSVAFALLTVAISMVFGWMYRRHGTLLGVTIFHAAIGLCSVAVGLN